MDMKLPFLAKHEALLVSTISSIAIQSSRIDVAQERGRSDEGRTRCTSVA